MTSFVDWTFLVQAMQLLEVFSECISFGLSTHSLLDTAFL